MPRLRLVNIGGGKRNQEAKDIMATWPTRLPLSSLEKILTAIALLVLVFTTIFVGMKYSSLPAEIPTHFGPGGKADAYGSRSEIWILLIVDIVCVGLVLACNFFPRAINIPVGMMMRRSSEEIIHATRLVMCWTAIDCAILIEEILRATVMLVDINTPLMIIIVVLMIVPMIPYYIYLMRP